MSMENVKKFYQAVATDESLRVRLSALNKQYDGEALDEEKKAALVEKLVLPIAAEKGLDFTMEDLRQYNENINKRSEDGELSSDELDAVAGGLKIGGICFIIGLGGVIAVGVCQIAGGFLLS